MFGKNKLLYAHAAQSRSWFGRTGRGCGQRGPPPVHGDIRIRVIGYAGLSTGRPV